MSLSDGLWNGRRAFIIGGGPSFAGFDFSLLKDELTIGINMAFVHRPTINLIYDLRLMERLTVDSTWAAYKGEKLWLNYETPYDRGRFPNVTELYECIHKGTGQPMWSKTLEEGLYRGNNAGVAALNLADILGASPICLMGYDFKGRAGQSVNWHSAYPAEWKQEENVYRSYIECFQGIKSMVKGRVVNLNPDSMLRCFDFNTVEIEGSRIAPRVTVAPSKPINGVVVNGPEGFGDTIYMRPAIRKLAEKYEAVFVRTPWPQVFWDILNARPSRPEAIFYRTQNANAAAVDPMIWHYPPGGLPQLAGFYGMDQFRAGMTITAAFLQSFKVHDPVDFSLKVDPAWEPAWLKELPRPYGIVHPPSIRREWMNVSRNPRPDYIQAVIDARPDIHWVSIGFNVHDQEWYEGPPLHGVARRYDNGELSVEQLLALLGRADVAVSGPCWLLPAAAALGTPLFCIFGGSIPPQLLIDPRMGGPVKAVAPIPFCPCFQNDHNCNKSISMGALLMEWARFAETIKERVAT